MGTCGCGSTNELYKIGNKVIVKETVEHCETCGQASITINELDDKYNTFSCPGETHENMGDLGVWMGKDANKICIGLKDLWTSVDAFIDDALEKVYEDDMTDKEFDAIDWDATQKLIKNLKKRMLERCDDQ